MQIEISSINLEQKNGEIIWFFDYTKRPKEESQSYTTERIISPTKGIFINKEENLSKYTSEDISEFNDYPYCICVVDNNNESTGRIVEIHGETFTSRFLGPPLKIFDNEEECISEWNSCVEMEIKMEIEEIQKEVKSLEEKILRKADRISSLEQQILP